MFRSSDCCLGTSQSWTLYYYAYLNYVCANASLATDCLNCQKLLTLNCLVWLNLTTRRAPPLATVQAFRGNKAHTSDWSWRFAKPTRRSLCSACCEQPPQAPRNCTKPCTFQVGSPPSQWLRTKLPDGSDDRSIRLRPFLSCAADDERREEMVRSVGIGRPVGKFLFFRIVDAQGLCALSYPNHDGLEPAASTSA